MALYRPDVIRQSSDSYMRQFLFRLLELVAMSLQGLVIADDLTGAMDTGHAFATRGYPTTVAVHADADGIAPETTVLVINTDSRYLPAGDAREVVARAVTAHPAAVIYKKIDSTLRGNLAVEIEAVLDTSGTDCALVAPAFPAHSRITACGYHLVNGTLVTDMSAGRDADKPVRSSHLPTLLDDAVRPVCHLSVETVAQGSSAVRETLNESSGSLIACDALCDAHLAVLANGAARSDMAVVYVGSAGLARTVRLPGDVPADGPTTSVEEATTRSQALAIVGSATPQTIEQVTALADEQVVALDMECAVKNPEKTAQEAAARAAGRLEKGESAVVTSVRTEADIEEALQAGRKRAVGADVVRDRIADALALAAQETWERATPNGLFVTGGAVAVAVLDSLDAAGVQLSGEEVEAGIPLGRITGGQADGTRIVTKAGAFGDERTIANCLDCLRGNNER
jgi:uncharacterized protein YgbK (DUF1537 family)